MATKKDLVENHNILFRYKFQQSEMNSSLRI